MGFQFYQPYSEFLKGSEVASFLAYASANLPFFSGPWLSQFVPCTALAFLWPGEKIAGMIQTLVHLQEQESCANLIVAYKKIYIDLTLTEFYPKNYDSYIHDSSASYGGD